MTSSTSPAPPSPPACVPSPTDAAPAYRPWTHRFAVLLVIATFILIVSGGTVTSKGVGMAVPDWPTTFGHNMFTVPLEKWTTQAGPFWEHSHRLKGSFVGVLTIIMTVLLWLPYLRRRGRGLDERQAAGRTGGQADSGGSGTQAGDRPWLRWLALVVLLQVIAQGVMGGLRVTEISITWAIVHGIDAQLFLCMTVLLAAATSRYWLRLAHNPPKLPAGPARTATTVFLLVLLVQLALGAVTRHHQAGLAIPDFPLAYEGLIPPTSEQGVQAARQQMMADQEFISAADYTLDQVWLHYAHRVWAIAVLGVGAWLIACLVPLARRQRILAVPVLSLTGLLAVQVLLGALIIWSQRQTEIATAHQATGAVILAIAALLAIRVRLVTRSTDRARGLEAAIAPGHPTQPPLNLKGAGA